jgi:hypothetical protein
MRLDSGDWRTGIAVASLRYGRSNSTAKPVRGVVNALFAFIRSAGNAQCALGGQNEHCSPWSR